MIISRILMTSRSICSDYLHTEVNVGLAGMGAADPRGCSDRTALVEGNELVQVVEVGKHLQRNPCSIHRTCLKHAVRIPIISRLG